MLFFIHGRSIARQPNHWSLVEALRECHHDPHLFVSPLSSPPFNLSDPQHPRSHHHPLPLPIHLFIETIVPLHFHRRIFPSSPDNDSPFADLFSSHSSPSFPPSQPPNPSAKTLPSPPLPTPPSSLSPTSLPGLRPPPLRPTSPETESPRREWELLASRPRPLPRSSLEESSPLWSSLWSVEWRSCSR